MEKEIYKNQLDTYISLLEKDIEFLKTSIAPEFTAIPINCGGIQADFKPWLDELGKAGIDNNCSVLYYISFEIKEDAQRILKAAKDAKGKLKKVALPQINHNRRTNILYVGKTNSNFPSRLKYHLGLVESKTYALHLKQWASQWNFTLHLAKLCFGEGELKYLEQLESALHISLEPLLGRSGH